MIGFGNEYKLFTTNKEGEGVDTKNLTKKEVFEIVNEDYMVAPVDSKGMTREYLLKVKDGEVFRIKNAEYKLFEFGLEKSHSKKVGIINNSLLVRKLNLLLLERGEKELGFTEFDLPNEAWLYKVARFIDRTNILEFFAAAPFEEEPATDKSSLTTKIHHGRILAGQWLFRVQAAKKNKKLYEAFQSLAEKHKYLSSCRMNVNVLEHELEETRRKVITMDQELNDLAGKTAFTYTSLENPKITPELVIGGGSSLTEEMKNSIQLNTKM